MIVLYRLLFLPLLAVALPYYLLRMFRRGGYADGFSHRFGRIPVPPRRDGVKRLWIQAVSVGEIGAIEPLLRELAKRPDIEVVLTTTTSTAYAIAREKLAGLTVARGVFPLDFAPFSAAAWKRIRPDAVVLTEGELWPEHLHRAKKSGVPAILVNARLSDRSFRRYSKVRPLAARLFGKLDVILAGSAGDLDRLLSLGVSREKASCSGNLKCDVDVGAAPDEMEKRTLFTELFGECPAIRPLVLIGSSTWPGDEELLLDLAPRLREQNRDVRLLIVPRHAERRDAIAALPQLAGMNAYFRSKHRSAPGPRDVCIADTTGELRRLTRAADLAFIGKSLPPNEGGQTPIECALLGVPQVFGPSMSNFRDISRGLVETGAAVRAPGAAGAGDAILALCRDSGARKTMSEAATRWSVANRGATARTLAAILGVLRRNSSASSGTPHGALL